jgi:hypothetical protein
VGNKIDLEDERVVPFEEAQDFARDCQIRFMEITTKSLSDVTNVFHEAVRLYRKHQQ